MAKKYRLPPLIRRAASSDLGSLRDIEADIYVSGLVSVGLVYLAQPVLGEERRQD